MHPKKSVISNKSNSITCQPPVMCGGPNIKQVKQCPVSCGKSTGSQFTNTDLGSMLPHITPPCHTDNNNNNYESNVLDSSQHKIYSNYESEEEDSEIDIDNIKSTSSSKKLMDGVTKYKQYLESNAKILGISNPPEQSGFKYMPLMNKPPYIYSKQNIVLSETSDEEGPNTDDFLPSSLSFSKSEKSVHYVPSPFFGGSSPDSPPDYKTHQYSPEDKKNMKVVPNNDLDVMFEAVDTNGIDYENYKKFTQKFKPLFVQCEMCLKFYKKSNSDFQIIAPNYDGQIACLHCIYYLNYCNKEVIDGVYGAPIFEYVAMCRDDHDITLCLKDNCFLCDSINEENNLTVSENIEDTKEEQITIFI